MARKKNTMPEIGELVMSTVSEIFPSHVYLILDDFVGMGKDGLDRSNFRVSEALKDNAVAYMHISEISNSWIKNIKEGLKEGQKIITKVLKLDNRMVWVSKRRVSDSERKKKINEWKRSNKAEGLLNLLAEHVGSTIDEVHVKLGYPLEEEYGGDVWAAFEDIKEQGIQAMMDLDFFKKLDESWRKELERLVNQNVELSQVEIAGEFELTCYASNGVEAVKESIKSAESAITSKDRVEMEFQVIAPPRYRLVVQADDYQSAELFLKKVETKVLKTIKKHGGQGSFHR